jgi:UDP-N-acetyl-D-mannosaminuronic acid dehydrogenase
VNSYSLSVVIVGGCGHVGLPLGIALAASGARTALYDINAEAVEQINRGELPFMEPGAAELLVQTTTDGTLRATTDPAVIADAENVVVVVGTPVDEHLNPRLLAVPETVKELGDHLRDGQLLVLRSTVYPGVTALVERGLADLELNLDVAFCPERIAEGKAMTELYELPQIVSSSSETGRKRAAELFRRLTSKIVHLDPEEAELAKLFTNTWRYIKFATANQLFVIANDFGLDFERIRSALAEDYPRAQDLPGAGFAAGPCLLKDTMQLAAFNNNNFTLGHAAMMINEGLPLYVVSRIEQRFDLRELSVGILGMAFKAGSDDIRSSLSYKLKRILRFRVKEVLTTDPYVTDDPELLPLNEVVERADLLIVGAPHPEYRELATSTEIIDIWNLRSEGSRV